MAQPSSAFAAPPRSFGAAVAPPDFAAHRRFTTMMGARHYAVVMLWRQQLSSLGDLPAGALLSIMSSFSRRARTPITWR